MLKKLSARHKKFCSCYLKCGQEKQAAEEVGYNPRYGEALLRTQVSGNYHNISDELENTEVSDGAEPWQNDATPQET
jgi:hypothetical protein